MVATLVMVEDPDFNVYWECTACQHQIPDPKSGKIEKTKACPKCGAVILEYAYIEEDED